MNGVLEAMVAAIVRSRILFRDHPTRRACSVAPAAYVIRRTADRRAQDDILKAREIDAVIEREAIDRVDIADPLWHGRSRERSPQASQVSWRQRPEYS